MWRNSKKERKKERKKKERKKESVSHRVREFSGCRQTDVPSDRCRWMDGRMVSSVTRWLECLLNILPFKIIKIRPIACKICQI